MYFRPDGTLFNSQLGGVAEKEDPFVLDAEAIEKAFDRAKPEPMTLTK